MAYFDRIFLSFIFAPIFPILFFLTSWWISLSFFHDSRVFVVALVGLILGIVLDILYLSHCINYAYKMSLILWLFIYVFYSVCFFGFFMGVPVFNLFLGIFVGIFVARQVKILKYSQEKIKKRIRIASWISVIYMTLICVCSAVIAIVDPYTTGNLKGMFNLQCNITREMLYWFIVSGGIFLIILQYLITKYSARLTYTKTHL